MASNPPDLNITNPDVIFELKTQPTVRLPYWLIDQMTNLVNCR